MRGPALLVVFVVGCIARPEQPWDLPGDPVPGPMGEGPGCTDSSCGAGKVCARNRACYPADQVRTVHADWTVRGMPASTTSCAGAPDLVIAFVQSASQGLRLSYAPVPCVEGKFTIDKLPMPYDRVELGRASGGAPQVAPVDATGAAVLDLPY
jgi:hypothetical protein